MQTLTKDYSFLLAIKDGNRLVQQAKREHFCSRACGLSRLKNVALTPLTAL